MIGTISIVNKKVAQKLNLPEQTVRAVNSAYMKELKRCLMHTEDINFFVRGLGTFETKLSGIRSVIHETISKIRFYERSKRTPEIKEIIIGALKRDLRNSLKQYNNLRYEIIRRKQIYADNKAKHAARKALSNTERVLPEIQGQEQEPV